MPDVCGLLCPSRVSLLIRANRQCQVERLQLGDAHHWCQPFSMNGSKHGHVKGMNRWICLVGNPEQYKW